MTHCGHVLRRENTGSTNSTPSYRITVSLCMQVRKSFWSCNTILHSIIHVNSGLCLKHLCLTRLWSSVDAIFSLQSDSSNYLLNTEPFEKKGPRFHLRTGIKPSFYFYELFYHKTLFGHKKMVLSPCIVLMHSKPWKSQSLMVMSAEQEASSLPVWSKEMSCTESVWPFRVLSKSPAS